MMACFFEDERNEYVGEEHQQRRKIGYFVFKVSTAKLEYPSINAECEDGGEDESCESNLYISYRPDILVKGILIDYYVYDDEY